MPPTAAVPTAVPPSAPVDAKKLVAPQAPESPDDQPGAVRPDAPKQPKTQVTREKPTRKLMPGDLICGNCGEGNAPERNFCSRCGHGLEESEVVRPPWWKRWIPRRRRDHAAGDRPWKSEDGTGRKRRQSPVKAILGKIRPVIGIVMLGLSVLYGIAPGFRESVNTQFTDVKDSVLDRFQPTFLTITPVEFSANAEEPGFPVSQVLDGGSNTSWIFTEEGLPALVVRFDQPVDLERMIILNGAADGFRDHHRVAEISLEFDTGLTFELTLANTPEPQTKNVENGSGITEIQIVIRGLHRSPSGTTTALTELEFFQKE